MRLYMSDIEYSATTFPESKTWDINELPASIRTVVLLHSISSAPEGKHDLSMCAEYERRWREVVPDVISALISEPRACFLWATGPLTGDGLVWVFPHIMGSDDESNRYHIEGITFVDDDGFRYGRVVFEFRKEGFVKLMGDENVDLEYNDLSLLIFPDDLVEEVITKPFHEIGIRWIIEQNAIALTPPRHFEGYYLLGRKDTLSTALTRVREAMEHIDWGE